jgi:hypothetical protein
MFDNTKYIVVGNQLSGDEHHGSLINVRIFPFHSSIKHKSMFEVIKRLRFNVLVSAGFIDEFMNCYGSSESLRASSRPNEDTELLHRMFDIRDKELKYK